MNLDFEDWKLRGACAVPTGASVEEARAMLALFFPNGRPSPAAENLCAGCPVRDECRDYADNNRIRFGVWGGAANNRSHTKTRPAADATADSEAA